MVDISGFDVILGCVCAWNFGIKLFLRRGECITREKFNFSEKG